MEPCNNCQFVFEGKYCPECGQKRYRPEDKSLNSLLKEAATSFYNLDGPVLRTLRTIYSRPGKMSEEYNQGIRKRYYKPVSLYFILIVLYLLFPIAQGLNVNLDNHLMNIIARDYSVNTVQQYIDTREISLTEFRQRFAATSANVSKFLLILFIPYTVLIFKLLFPLRKFYLFDLTVAATELNILYLSLSFLLFPLFVLTLHYTTGLILGELLFTGISTLLFLTWSLFFFHRFFHEPWYLTLLKSLLFVILHFLFMVNLYRFIVFQTTIWLM